MKVRFRVFSGVELPAVRVPFSLRSKAGLRLASFSRVRSGRRLLSRVRPRNGVNLAVSLHAVRDDLRNELVPLNRKSDFTQARSGDLLCVRQM